MNYMKTIACRDAEFDCDHVVEGGTEDEVLERGKEHLIKEHGMKEEHITPEIKEKARRAEEDKKLFLGMLEKCQIYSIAINVRTFDHSSFRAVQND